MFSGCHLSLESIVPVSHIGSSVLEMISAAVLWIFSKSLTKDSKHILYTFIHVVLPVRTESLPSFSCSSILYVSLSALGEV